MSQRRGHVVAIGVFDGVHLGHRAMLDEACARARELERESGGPVDVWAATFTPHPRAVVGGGAPALLTSLEQRVTLLGQAGAMRVEVIPFTKEFSQQEPQRFAAEWLRDRFEARVVVVGGNFRFGRKAAGDVEMLGRLGAELGFEVVTAPLRTIADTPVSSSRIRSELSEGNAGAATELLGRPYTLDGLVVRGAGRGRLLGIPTANIHWDASRLVPADGVYAGVARLGERRLRTAISVGTNPQFTEASNEAPRTVEAHLLDFDEDIYDEHLEVTFEHWLRGQDTFPGVEQLVEQINADIARVWQLPLSEPLPTASGHQTR